MKQKHTFLYFFLKAVNTNGLFHSVWEQVTDPGSVIFSEDN